MHILPIIRSGLMVSTCDMFFCWMFLWIFKPDFCSASCIFLYVILNIIRRQLFLANHLHHIIWHLGHFRWCNGYQARLENLHEWVQFSLGARLIRPCSTSKNKSLVNYYYLTSISKDHKIYSRKSLHLFPLLCWRPYPFAIEDGF